METWGVVPNLWYHVAPLDAIAAVVSYLIPMWCQCGANVVSTSSLRYLNTTAIEIAPVRRATFHRMQVGISPFSARSLRYSPTG